MLALFPILLVLGAGSASADALLKKGVELRRHGKDAEALVAFREAYEKSKSPRALAQIALAEQALSSWLDADEHLDAALAEAADPWIKEHAQTLHDAQAKIREHVGRLEVIVSAPGARVRVDGGEPVPLPLASPVRHLAGMARVSVEAEGYRAVERSIDVPPNDLARAVIELQPLAPPKVSEPAPRVAVTPAPEPQPSLAPYAYVALGGAVAGAATGVVALIVRAGHVSRYNDPLQCLPANGLTREENCGEERRSAEQAQTIAIAGFAAGGALAATGVLLLVLDSSGDAKTAMLAPGPGDLGLALTLSVP